MQSYRLSKYNPAFRDANGAYARAEWTSFSDVGGSFGGKILTLSDYLRVESLYLDAVEESMRCSGVDSVTLMGLEITSDIPQEMSDYRELFWDGVKLNFEAARVVSTFVLREFAWCKLVGRRDFFIHFGYDYYLYTGGSFKFDLRSRVCGLYVEDLRSPYLDA